VTPSSTVLARVAADQRVRYLFAGGVGAACYYGLFAAGWLAAGRAVPYLVLTALASTLTAVATYPIYRHLVFRATGPWLAGFLKFYVICLWALGFNLAGMWVLVTVLRLHPLIGQAIVITVGPVINYQASRLWAFRRPVGP
jgi:putative flippase GtrA